MDYNEFLNRVINEGISSATADYTDAKDKNRLDGSIAGFEACRDLTPNELVDMFKTASKYMNEAFGDKHSDYWYFRCYQAEVEWVLNVVCAMLYNQGLEVPVSHLPTYNGLMKAASILGTTQ